MSKLKEELEQKIDSYALDAYIEKTEKFLKIAESYKEKGYTEFLNSLKSDELSKRGAVFEYILAGLVKFFKDNGVDYQADLSKYASFIGQSITLEDIYQTQAKNKAVITKSEYASNITFEDGMLDYSGLLYAIGMFPEIREQLVEVFGSELISEDVFPDLTKLGIKLEKIKEISRSIVLSSRIYAMDEAEIKELAKEVNEDLILETKTIDEIVEKISSIESVIKQSKIYDFESHPGYKQLQENLKLHMDTREKIINSIDEACVSDLVENIEKTLHITDYRTEMRILEISHKLQKEGITAEQEKSRIDIETEQHDSMCQARANMNFLSDVLGKLAEFKKSEEFYHFINKVESYSICMERLRRAEDSCKKQYLLLQAAKKAKKEYDSLSFLEKIMHDGLEMKLSFKDLKELEKNYEKASNILGISQHNYCVTTNEKEESYQKLCTKFDSLFKDNATQILDRKWLDGINEIPGYRENIKQYLEDKYKEISDNLLEKRQIFDSIYMKDGRAIYSDVYNAQYISDIDGLITLEKQRKSDPVYVESLEKAWHFTDGYDYDDMFILKRDILPSIQYKSKRKLKG